MDEEGEIRCYWNNEFKELKVIMSTTRTGKMAAWREAIFAPQRVNFVKQLTAWAAQYDAEDGFGAEKLAEKILARVSKWTEISTHTLKEMYASDENGGLDTAQIMRFDELFSTNLASENALKNSTGR